MPAHWSIEDNQTIPLTAFIGDDHPHISGIMFHTDPVDAHNMRLTLNCEDGTTYALAFNRNGIPQGPAVKTEPPAPPVEPPPPAPAGASLHHEPAPKKKY